ncbi:hypothetical protein GT347_06990 [Xylophilus rhododendri]|uniref:Uncharacterized protein n=1 Tax=Xylophilus rhododendri TaxID=2697032 RepID=A0A857J2A0_9BURK|nr:hypothetical protein [Xylophilus rhododendri]QHI97757.1 hypothetical protein GT347_06990 [Xylophilus rhododendri]
MKRFGLQVLEDGPSAHRWVVVEMLVDSISRPVSVAAHHYGSFEEAHDAGEAELQRVIQGGAAAAPS